MTIYWVDDDLEILNIIEMVFGMYEVKTYAHWDLVPELKKGDLIFHDHDGVGPRPEKIEGVAYYCCSGNCEIKKDFEKPFPVDKVMEIMGKYRKSNT